MDIVKLPPYLKKEDVTKAQELELEKTNQGCLLIILLTTRIYHKRTCDVLSTYLKTEVVYNNNLSI